MPVSLNMQVLYLATRSFMWEWVWRMQMCNESLLCISLAAQTLAEPGPSSLLRIVWLASFASPGRIIQFLSSRLSFEHGGKKRDC